MAQFVISAFSDEAGSSLFEQIAGLNRNNIAYTELRSVNDKNVLTLTDDELYKIKAELDKNNINVNSLGSPIGKYPITEPFEPHLKDFRRALEICHILGTDKMRMFSFFTEQDKLSEYRPEVMRRLKIMADEAKASGITLCHENESKIYGQMPEGVLDILTEIPEIKGVFDGANYRMHNADTIKGIEATLTNLAYLHIKDAIFEAQMVVPAGEGEARLAEVIEAVDKHTGATVFMTVEPHLRVFGIYKAIDDKELNGKYVFETAAQAFDYAVASLKNLLTSLGFKEYNGVWKR